MSETPAWLWLNLLSLDAPLVALVWQDFAAHTFHNPLRPAARIVLGLTVWAVYLSDRLLDVRAAAPATARHRFYHRHPRPLLALLAAVLIVDTLVAALDLRREIFLHGVAVAVCVCAYLVVFPRRPSGGEKQVLAAVLFAAGVLLVSATWLGLRLLWIPGALFAALCLCNLLLIEVLERNPARRAVWLAPAAVALLAAVRPAGAWHTAIAVSGLLLAALAVAAPRLSADALRVLADAVLLTPLFFR
jgi:hypothetical protein